MTDLILTPVLAAALANAPRRRVSHKGGGGRKKIPHNFVAEAGKRKPGAPLGNRNAAARDTARVESRTRLARVQALVAQTRAMADAVLAAVDEDLKARARLSTLLLPGA